MAIQDYKVSEAYSGRDIASLSDRPNQDGMTAAQLKARFDQLNKEVIPNYNDLIDLLKALLEDGSVTNGHTHNVDNLVDGIVNRLFTEVLKLKLDDIEEGAEVNQNAFSSIKVGGSTGNANSKTATFEIVAGLNIVASFDPLTNKITLSATGDLATEAVQSYIEDIGNYFTSLNVEGALQEVGLSLLNKVDKVAGKGLSTNDFDNTYKQKIDTDIPALLRKTSGIYNVLDFLCDDGQYVKGDGTHDDTTGIQKALNEARGKLIFPKGIYKVTAKLVLSRNLDIEGFNLRDSVIRGDGLPTTDDILSIIISDNFGSGDVRNWKISNITILPNIGARHSLYIGGTEDGAMQMLSCQIENCMMKKGSATSGKGLYINNNFAHGKITGNQIDSAYLKFYDANLIEKNLFAGNDWAIIIDIINGVRNNVIRDNTIVNKAGHILILNGSNIRIQNNQLEQPSLSTNSLKTMIKIEGADLGRSCENIIISENNFGGGTNLDRLIYIDNAYKVIVEKNNLISVNVAEIELTAKAKYCVIKFDNTIKTSTENPRTRTAFKANIIDNGVGTAGVLKDGTLLNHQNGWTGGDFYKDGEGRVHFNKTFNAGVTAIDTILGTLPLGFRPPFQWNAPSATTAGVCVIQIDTAGVIRAVTSIPSSAGLSVSSFPAATTE